MHEKGEERGETTPWRLHQCFGVRIQNVCYQEAWRIQPFAPIWQKIWQYAPVCKLYKCVPLFRNSITLKSSYA